MTTANEPLPGMPEPPPTSAHAELIALLTCAQQNWRMAYDAPNTMTTRDRIHTYAAIAAQVGEASYLLALRDVAPEVAQAKAVDVNNLCDDGSEVGPWIYEQLVALGQDPEAIPKLEWTPDPEIARLQAEIAETQRQLQTWQHGTRINEAALLGKLADEKKAAARLAVDLEEATGLCTDLEHERDQLNIALAEARAEAAIRIVRGTA